MVDRKKLHELIDSLPEGALESAQTYLRNIQEWPPKPPEYPPEVIERRKKLEALRDKFLAHRRAGTSCWAIDRNNKTHASCGDAAWNRGAGEYTVKTFRVHHDFPLEISERFQTTEDCHILVYKMHIRGLGNEGELQLEFRAQ